MDEFYEKLVLLSFQYPCTFGTRTRIASLTTTSISSVLTDNLTLRPVSSGAMLPITVEDSLSAGSSVTSRIWFARIIWLTVTGHQYPSNTRVSNGKFTQAWSKTGTEKNTSINQWEHIQDLENGYQTNSSGPENVPSVLVKILVLFPVPGPDQASVNTP